MGGGRAAGRGARVGEWGPPGGGGGAGAASGGYWPVRLTPEAAGLAGAAAAAAAASAAPRIGRRAAPPAAGAAGAAVGEAAAAALEALAEALWVEADARGLELAQRLRELEAAWDARAGRGELPAPEELESLRRLEAASRPVLNFPQSLSIGEARGAGPDVAGATPAALVITAVRRALEAARAADAMRGPGGGGGGGSSPGAREPLERLRGCSRALRLCLAKCSQAGLKHTQWLRVLTDYAGRNDRTKVWSEKFSARAPRARLSGNAPLLPTVAETLVAFGQ